MRLRRLTLEGFGSFRERCELDLADVRLAAICGLNGSGKSTLLDGAIWCLYGAVPHTTNASLLNLRSDVSEMTVEVEFDHEADASGQVIVGAERHVHQVKRTWRQTDGGGSSAAQHSCDGVIVAQTSRSVTTSVVHVLGADVSTLTATMFSRQFEHGLFNALRPGERQKLLRKPLPLAEWNEKKQAADQGHLATEAKLAKARLRLSQAKEAAESLDDLIADADQAKAAAKAAADALADLQSRALSRSDRRNLEQAETAAAEQAQLKRDRANAKRRLGRLTNPLEEKRKELAAAEKASQTKARAYLKLEKREGECTGRVSSSERAADEAADQLQLLEDGGLETCWVCEQPLTATHLKSLKEKLRAPIKAHDDAKKELVKVRRQLKTAQTAAVRAQETEDQLSNGIKAQEANLRRCEKEIASTEATMQANEKLLENLETLRKAAKNQSSAKQVKAAQDRLTTAERHTGALSERLSAAKRAASKVDAHSASVAELSRDLQGLVILKRAFAPSGIPRLAARNVMRHVALAANTTMRRLGSPLEMRLAGFSGTEEHDEFVDEEEELSGELEVEARGASSEPWRPYATFSGGERLRMDVASRLALIHTLGVRCDLLTFDEGWGNLDPPGRQAFVSLMHELVVNGEVQQVLTISHVAETLKKFDAFISVTYDPDTGSHAEVVTGAAPDTALAIAQSV